MPATIAAAKAGATTGEWSQTMREVFGAYRGPTGVDGATALGDRSQLESIQRQVEELARRSATGSRSWSASRASTATPTAPSRSPYEPATSAWR